MKFRHFASLNGGIVNFPLLLKEGWSDLFNLHFEKKLPGQTGVVDSLFKNTKFSFKYLLYFIQDKLRFLENKPILKPKNKSTTPAKHKGITIFINFNSLSTPPSKGGETSYLNA